MLDLAIILFLILLNSLFAMAEIALVSSKKVRLQTMADKGDKGAIKALELQDKPGYFLSSIQVGITFIAIFSGIIGEKSFMEPTSSLLENMGVPKHFIPSMANFIVIFTLTSLSVIFGEIIPKSIALTLSDKIASLISRPMNVFTKLFFPFIWFFDSASALILSLLKLNKYETPPITNEEIKELMGQGAEAGIFHESEQKMVANVLHMDEKQASSIMTHRTEWKFIDLNDDFKVNIAKLIENKKSKVLAVRGDTNNIVGVVHVTDILDLIYNGNEFELEKYVKSPIYLPFTVTVSQVLESFKNTHNDVAIIINEYGENIGIITSSDILSVLVGDIDEPSVATDKEIILREDGSILFDGIIALDKVYDYFAIEKFSTFPDIHTLGGYIMATSGAVPSVSFTTIVDSPKYILTLEVVDMDKHCVDKILATFVAKNQEILDSGTVT